MFRKIKEFIEKIENIINKITKKMVWLTGYGEEDWKELYGRIGMPPVLVIMIILIIIDVLLIITGSILRALGILK